MIGLDYIHYKVFKTIEYIITHQLLLVIQFQNKSSELGL